jgi:hypothetical protein
MSKSEVLIYNGHRYRRYPNSKHPHHRKYFYGTEPRRGFLHRHVWEDVYGKIKENYEIHHIDGNTLNNDITNLEHILCSEHRAQHLSKRSKTEKHQKHMVEARKKAVEWHRSTEGRLWKSKMVKDTWFKRKKYDKVCENCNIMFKTPFPTRAKFCGSKCQNQAYYRKST